MKLTLDAGVLTVARPDDEAENRAAHGLTRTLLENMIVGVSTGYSKTLQIVGVGYRAALQGKNLLLNLGYSHPITVEAPEGITFEVPDTNTIIVKGFDKQVVGQVAAVIRSKRKPEPYHGKGVKYSDEVVRRKAGKAGGKGK
jgi:large subunit ribosomal protein L6